MKRSTAFFISFFAILAFGALAPAMLRSGHSPWILETTLSILFFLEPLAGAHGVSDRDVLMLTSRILSTIMVAGVTGAVVAWVLPDRWAKK
jgi:hypothetical protein